MRARILYDPRPYLLQARDLELSRARKCEQGWVLRRPLSVLFLTPSFPFMLLDFEVQRCSRRCSATEKPLEPGDECYSVLESVGADVVRKDFCSQAWKGPPETAFGWWRSRVPEPTARKIRLAPNDVLLELLDRLAEQPEQRDLRYVLSLLLIRRRVLRVDMPQKIGHCEGNAIGSHLEERMSVYCPKREATYEVVVAMPQGQRIDEIQQRLSDLLIADAE
jgi:hypothetical protein